MTYRVTAKFVTIYTKEEETKIEYTDDFRGALGAFEIYMENPETVFCSIDIPDTHNLVKKIVAAYTKPW